MMLQVIVRAFNGEIWSEIETVDIVNEGESDNDLHLYSVHRWSGTNQFGVVRHNRSDGALTLVRKALEGLGQ